LRAERDHPHHFCDVRACAAIAVLLIAACADTVRVELPDPPSGTRSAIVAIEHGAAIEIAAIDLEQQFRLPHVESFGGEARMIALYYDESLSALALEPGALRRAEPDEDRGPLPLADHAFAAEIDEGRTGEFAALDPAMLGGAIAEYEIPRAREHDCFAIKSKIFGLDTRSLAVLIARYDDRQVLVGAEDRSMYLVTTSSVTKLDVRIPESVDSLGVEPFAAFRAPDGTIYIGANHGFLLKGDLVRGFDLVDIRPAAPGYIEGPTVANVPFEMFAMSLQGHFEYFDGTRFQTIEDFGVEQTLNFGGLVRVGPGEAITTPPYTKRVVRYARGSLTDIPLSNAFGEVRTLVRTNAGEVYALADPAFIVRILSDNYENVAETPNVRPRTLAPMRNGFVSVVDSGGLTNFQPLDGICPLGQVEGLNTQIYRSVTLGETAFFLGTSDERDRNAQVIIVEPAD
jgi:hypothetical protein